MVAILDFKHDFIGLGTRVGRNHLFEVESVFYKIKYTPPPGWLAVNKASGSNVEEKSGVKPHKLGVSTITTELVPNVTRSVPLNFTSKVERGIVTHGSPKGW